MSDNDIDEPLPNQRPSDIRGLLTFDAPLPDNLQRLEDSRAELDRRYMLETGRTRFGRLATDTERALLRSLGYELPPVLRVVIDFRTSTLRRRTFPSLES